MGRSRSLLLILILFLLLAVGCVLRPPEPEISVHPEVIFHLGPFPVRNTLITSWLVILFLLGLAFFATRRPQLVPRGLQNLVEMIVEATLNLVTSVAGEHNGRRFFPAVATILFYIAVANWFGLLPFFNTIGRFEELTPETFHEKAAIFRDQGVKIVPISTVAPLEDPPGIKIEGVSEEASPQEKEAAIRRALAEAGLKEGEKAGIILPFFRSVNTDVTAPLALAIMSAIFVEYWGISTLGLFRYGRRFFNFGGILRGLRRLSPMQLFQGFIDAFVGLLELVSELVRLVSFTFRLFGNIFAGEVLLLVVGFLLPWIGVLPFYGLEIFVGFIQAFIFAMLTLAFGMVAVTSHGPEEGGGH